MAAGSEREVGILVLYVVADCVFDGGGEGKLKVWVGTGNLDAIHRLGYSEGPNKVSLVFVGEGEAADTGDGVDGVNDALVEYE